MKKVKAYLSLMRPANIVTSLADVMMGFAVSGITLNIVSFPEFNVTYNFPPNLIYLLASSAFLYGGGVVLNDYYDSEIDQLERPERPIPSGHASQTGAMSLGIFLSVSGMICGMGVSFISGMIAMLIALFSVLYNKYTKKTMWGPLNMGACRALNMALGMSIFPEAIMSNWFLLFIPIIYVAAITIVSRSEVAVTGKRNIETGFLLYIIMVIGVFNLTFLENFNMLNCLPFLVLFVIATIPYYIKSLLNPSPIAVRKSVRNSILALIVLDASVAAGYAGIETALTILILLPISLVLAKGFAVT